MNIPTILKKIKALEGLSPEDCQSIIENTSLKKVEKGLVLFKEGDDGDGMYIIRSGSVRIFKQDNNKEVDIAILKEKQFFGEMALMADQKRIGTAIVLENSELYVVTTEAFTLLLKKNPDMAKRISEEFMRRLNENIRNNIS